VFSLLCFVWFYLIVAGLVLPVVLADVFDLGLLLVPEVDLGEDPDCAFFSEELGVSPGLVVPVAVGVVSTLTAFGIT
jgi:hypothetical protein